MEEHLANSQAENRNAVAFRSDILNLLLSEFKAKSLGEALQKTHDFFQLIAEINESQSTDEKRRVGQQALDYIKILLSVPVLTREIRDFINHGLQIAIRYGNTEAKTLLTRHQEVCQLLAGEFGLAYYEAFSENDPAKIQELCKNSPDQLHQVLAKEIFCLINIEEIYFQLGDVYQVKAHGKAYGPEREMAKQCYYLAARLGSENAKNRLQVYLQIYLIEKDDFDFQYHQAFINYNQPDIGNDLEKDIRNVCKLNPNKFCQKLATDLFILASERQTWQQYLIKYHFDELSHENQQSLRSVVVEMETPEARFVPSPDDIEMDDLSSENRTVKKVKSIDEIVNDTEKLLQQCEAVVKNPDAPEKVKIKVGGAALKMAEMLKKLVLVQKPLTRKLSDLITYGLEIAVASGKKKAKALLEAHKTDLHKLHERVEATLSETNIILGENRQHFGALIPNISKTLKEELSVTFFAQVTHLESLIFMVELSEEKDEMCRTMMTELLKIAIAWGDFEVIPQTLYQRGNECKNLAAGKTLDCPQLIAATRHYLLAASLGHPLASSEILALCKLNPNQFSSILKDNLSLAKEECETWQTYVDRHYSTKTLPSQKSVFTIKASFFESFSDEEKNTTEVTLSSEKDILNSNNSATPC